jgi:cysteine desulfurase
MDSHQPRQIYLDHAATTPVAPEVMDAMLPFFTQFYGNPSSIHGVGRRAAVALQNARRSVASQVNARPGEIIFTGCGTESDNMALRGIALARRATSGAQRIVTSAIEHKAVLATAEDLRDRYGFVLTVIPVAEDAAIDPSAIANAVGDGHDVALVSIMAANNEVGTIQPIGEIGAICRAKAVPFHTDAVQAAGKLSIDVDQLQVDALSVAAHKFYGPKGVGFLYLRSGTPFWPTLTGGSHEGDRRSGTENVPLIVGLAKALELAETLRIQEDARLSALRDQLIDGVLAAVEGAHLTGSRHNRLANHASFVLDGADAEGALIALDLAGIAASSGSACSSGSQRPSHVLEAMGIPPALAAGALRFSLGRSTTTADIDYLLANLPTIVERVRG